MAGGTLASRVTGLARTIVFLWFGTTALAETYTKANNTPNMIFELVIGGVLSATLVPLFVDLTRRETNRVDRIEPIDPSSVIYPRPASLLKRTTDSPDPSTAPETSTGVDAIISLVAVILVGAVVALFAAAPALMWIVFHRPDEGVQRQLGTDLLRLFAPQVAVYGFVTVATAMLNARRRFLAPMLAPVLNNLVVIIVLIWARRLVVNLVPDEQTRAVDSLATLRAVAVDVPSRLLLGLGTTAGVVAMGVALFVPWIRSGARVRWHWQPGHPAVKRMLRLSGWTLGYVAANLVTLQFVSGALPGRGDFTAYTIAYTTFFLLPHGVFAVSIMTALQPELAEAYLNRKRGIFRRHLTNGIRSILAISVPAAAGYIALAPSIMRIFVVGDLTPERSRLVADVLRCFVVGLPAFSVYLLLMNACKAMLDTRSTFVINCVENAINIVLAGVLVRFGFGAQGLAVAFAVAYMLAVLLAGYHVARRTGGLDTANLFRVGQRILGASVVMGIVVWAAARGLHELLEGRFAIAEVGVAAGLGVSVYVVLGRLLGVGEIESVVQSVRRRLR